MDYDFTSATHVAMINVFNSKNVWLLKNLSHNGDTIIADAVYLGSDNSPQETWKEKVSFQVNNWHFFEIFPANLDDIGIVKYD